MTIPGVSLILKSQSAAARENLEPAVKDHTKLLLLADPILVELQGLYHLTDDADPTLLRQSLSVLLQQFEHDAKLAGIPALKVLSARYILCAVLDEAILYSTWGQKNHWDRNSLLSLFHNDTRGGEQVFILLDKALKESRFNLDLLALIYVCLALGFEGQYRIACEGQQQLQRLRQELWHILNSEALLDRPLSILPATNIRPDSNQRLQRRRFGIALATGSAILALSYLCLYNSLVQQANSLQPLLQHALITQPIMKDTQGEIL